MNILLTESGLPAWEENLLAIGAFVFFVFLVLLFTGTLRDWLFSAWDSHKAKKERT